MKDTTLQEERTKRDIEKIRELKTLPHLEDFSSILSCMYYEGRYDKEYLENSIDALDNAILAFTALHEGVSSELPHEIEGVDTWEAIYTLTILKKDLKNIHNVFSDTDFNAFHLLKGIDNEQRTKRL